MKLSASFALLIDLRYALQAAFVPTIKAIFCSPSLLFHPHEISRLFMSHVWTVFGNGIDENSCPAKQGLITANAKGIVLDIGAGHGHTVLYLDRERVTKYIALEPNLLMHDEIRKLAASKGFTESAGTLTILPYGAEDTALIVSALGEMDSVDTLISILTLCSIPRPEQSLKALVDEVLKPGGQLLFYEHVLSPLDDVAWWQHFWTPLWKTAFDGCCLDRPTHVWVRKMAGWSSGEVLGKEGEDEENLFWHRVGKFVKAKSSDIYGVDL